MKRTKRLKPPDIPEIMYHLGRGLALITVAYTSLNADDAETAGCPECVVLEEGIAKLKEVYNELDAADIQLGKVLERR